MQIIKEGGPVAWTARLPDLTLLDFLWGFMKSKVYQTDKLETRLWRLESINRPITAI
jgi:hypothetical protein